MRKQTKLAVVLAAAALLAVGSASIVSAAGWVQEGAEWRYQDNSGDYVTESMKKSGDTTFYLDENGYMAKDYFCNYNENYYYFGSNGAMVRNTWVAIDPSLVDNADDDADAYWFYFQDTGKAFKATDGVKKKKIDGKTYFFDEEGKMMTGWFNASGDKHDPQENNDFLNGDEEYYCGEDGVARSGWLAYSDGLNEETTLGESELSDRTTLYFYFNTTNFKRYHEKEKTINGKKYYFADNGVMMTGWEYFEEKSEGNDRLATSSNNKYYSGEDDGHMVKKGWVYAVPSKYIDSEKNNDDEEAYFYFNNSGEMIVKDQKRINGKYYIFAGNGIMKTGLIILTDNNQYKEKIDLDYTSGADFIKKTKYYTGENETGTFATGNKDFLHGTATQAAQYTIHYFGSDGAKVTGTKIPVEFSDDTYVFASKNKGGYVTKTKSKYYSNGFLLKASDDIRLGLVVASETQARKKLTDVNTGLVGITEANEKACYVVTTSGSQKKKGAYKDADGNYWLVNGNKLLVGIYDVQVKWSGDTAQWKGDVAKNTTYTHDGKKTSTTEGKDDVFIDFSTTGGTQYKDRKNQTQNDHKVNVINDYCLNFYVAD